MSNFWLAFQEWWLQISGQRRLLQTIAAPLGKRLCHLEKVQGHIIRQARRWKRKYKREQAIRAQVEMEARCWKQEALTQQASLHECYQAVTCGHGEPGDWNGAEPVREEISRLRAELEYIHLAADQNIGTTKSQMQNALIAIKRCADEALDRQFLPPI